MKKGFTLIEVLISILIFAFLATGAYQVLGSAIDTDEIAGKKISRLGEIQKVISLMDMDFNHIAYRSNRYVTTSSHRYIWAQKNIYNSDDWAIEFVRASNMNPGAMLDRNELLRVAYRLKNNNLERGTYVRTDPAQNDEPNWEIVLKNVSRFEFRFNASSTSINWTGSTASTSLPHAIEVTMTLEDVGKIRRVYRVVRP